MPGDARLRSPKALHDVAHAEFSTLQDVKNPQPCPVGKRPEHQVNAVLRLGLHGLRHTRNNRNCDWSSSDALGLMVSLL